MAKTVAELKKTALIYWPKEIAEKEKSASVIPLLLDTQESFISVLKLATATHEAWIQAIALSNELYPNLFLKHLCVISDVGGENLKRYATELPELFKNNPFTYVFQGKIHTCKMASLVKGRKWSSENLGLDGNAVSFQQMDFLRTRRLTANLCIKVEKSVENL